MPPRHEEAEAGAVPAVLAAVSSDEKVLWSSTVRAPQHGALVQAALTITDQRILCEVPAGSGELRRVELAHIVDIWECIDAAGGVIFETDTGVLALDAGGDRPAMLAALTAVFPVPTRRCLVEGGGGPELPHAEVVALLGKRLCGPSSAGSPRPRLRHGCPAPPGAVVADERTLLGLEECPTGALLPGCDVSSTVRIVRIPGKGRGLVAARDFAAGDDIWVEMPRVTFIEGGERRAGGDCWRNPELREFVMALDAHDHLTPWDSIDTGASCGEGGAPSGWHRRWARVVKLNAWGYSVSEESSRALFGLGSMVNHSCDPNARYDTKDGRDGAVFRAVRPIRRGEEITVSYVQLPTRAQAQAQLLEEKGFTCACQRCLSPDAARRLRCPACRGFGAAPLPPDWREWACGDCGQRIPAAALPLAEEKWIQTLAEAHSEADYSAEHHVAVLELAAERLSPLHCAVALIAEQILQLSGKAGIPPEGFFAVVRLLCDWAQRQVPHTWTSRPAVAQAVAGAIKPLQEGGDVKGAVAAAREAAGALASLRGPDDEDIVALKRIAALQQVPPLRRFRWTRWRQELAPIWGDAEFKERVARHVQRLGAALDRRDDPPVGGWPPPGQEKVNTLDDIMPPKE